MVANLHWTMTAWSMNGKGGWRDPPIILVEGQLPFYADHPRSYMEKLQELHDNPVMERGPFFLFIGQLKDALDYHWGKHEESSGGNGYRVGSELPRD